MAHKQNAAMRRKVTPTGSNSRVMVEQSIINPNGVVQRRGAMWNAVGVRFVA